MSPFRRDRTDKVGVGGIGAAGAGLDDPGPGGARWDGGESASRASKVQGRGAGRSPGYPDDKAARNVDRESFGGFRGERRAPWSVPVTAMAVTIMTALGALPAAAIQVTVDPVTAHSAALRPGSGTGSGTDSRPEAQPWEGSQVRSGSVPSDTLRITMDEALRSVLGRSRDLAEARYRLEEAEEQVSEAWGSVFPRVDLNASYTRNITPAASFFPAIFFDPDADPDELIRVQFGADNVWGTTLSLEQPLFEARAFIGVGAAGRFRALQEEVVRGRTHEVVTRVRQLYFDLLLAQEQSRLLERSVERVIQSLEETRALNRAGLASDYDVLRLEVELANLEPQLRRAQNQARARERELATELDLPDGTRVEVAGELIGIDVEDLGANTGENRRILELMGVEPGVAGDAEGMDRLFRQALLTSSSLQQLEMEEELRVAELRVEQAEYLPRVSLFGNYQVAAQQDGAPEFFATSGRRGYGRSLGIQVSVPVFTGLQRRARVEQKQATLRAARVQREVAGERLKDRLWTLVEEVDEARLRARGQRLAVEQARRGFEIASAQYREGLGSQLELTDAEVALRQSEFNYAEAVYAYLSNRARLDEEVGQVPTP